MTSTQIAAELDTNPATAIPMPTAHRPAPQRLVLTGFMGAGKTTIGRLLSDRLGWGFLDLDAHLEKRTGQTVPDIFAQHGEDRFRRLESTALASALTHRSTVIALGGGTPERLTNRLLLEQTPATFVIFLDAPFTTLFDRCVLQQFGDPSLARPVLADPDAAQARFAARHPLYVRLAGITIDTAALTPEQTVDALLFSLNQSNKLTIT
jgi:shikimate kinase